jgi:hypothetical protein
MKPLSSIPHPVRPGNPPGLILLISAAVVLMSARCGGRIYLVNSLPPTRAIAVDGDAEDWTNALSYVSSAHIFVGFVNDRDDLYVCMTKEVEEARPRAPFGAMGGLTVWIDPSGGTEKRMGIRLGGGGRPPEERQDREARRRPEEEPSARGAGEGRPPGMAEGLEIIGPNGNVLKKMSFEEASTAGLEVKTVLSGGSFVLEMKIPLKATDVLPMAVGSGDGGVVGVGFLSSRSGEKGRPGRPPGEDTGGRGGYPGGGGMPGGMGGIGGMGGMGGRGGGMGGGRRPNMNPDIQKNLKVWTKVKLNTSAEPRRALVLEIEPATCSRDLY